jgi:hypothetical protein
MSEKRTLLEKLQSAQTEKLPEPGQLGKAVICSHHGTKPPQLAYQWQVVGKPWEQQPQENNKHFKWFRLFLHTTNPRSVKGLSELIEVSYNTLNATSRKWRWQWRAEKYDEQLEDALARSDLAEVDAMRRRHILLGVSMQSAAALEMRAHQKKIEDAAREAEQIAIQHGLDPRDAAHEPLLSIIDLIRLAKYGVEMERLSRGQHTEHLQLTDKAMEEGLKKLNPEQLRALKELRKIMDGE